MIPVWCTVKVGPTEYQKQISGDCGNALNRERPTFVPWQSVDQQ
jgi:hypothetical protein